MWKSWSLHPTCSGTCLAAPSEDQYRLAAHPLSPHAWSWTQDILVDLLWCQIPPNNSSVLQYRFWVEMILHMVLYSFFLFPWEILQMYLVDRVTHCRNTEEADSEDKWSTQGDVITCTLTIV